MTLVILILGCTSMHAQDLIFKTDGSIIPSRVGNIEETTIQYRHLDSLGGPMRRIDKSHVRKLVYQNGKTVQFEGSVVPIPEPKTNPKTKPTATNTEVGALKQIIVDAINAHGFHPNSFSRRFKANFEGNYLHLNALKRKSEEYSKDDYLYDFANVYEFQRISNRSDDLAYINIFVAELKDKAKNEWTKEKLVMRVDSPKNAEEIVTALKQLNQALTK